MKKNDTKSIVWIAERRKVKDLLHFERNPRKITAAAMEKLKERITKRGFHDVVKVDTENVVLSGNMRLDALLQLGYDYVNVLVPDRKLSAEERDAVVLESNRNDGTWDSEPLATFSSEVLLEVGFESSEVDFMKADDEDEEDPFDVEKAVAQIKKPMAKRGDIYKLGDHRVMCGDSTSGNDVRDLMGGVVADMVFTDPPYNMNYRSAKKGGILNDNMDEEKFADFCVAFMERMKENSRTGAAFYICSGYQSYLPFLYAMKYNMLNYAGPIIWVKNTLGIGNSDYRPQHEMILKAKKEAGKKKATPILYGWNGARHFFAGGRDNGDVWNVDRRGTNTMSHPTQKPIALINKALKNSSKRGDMVLDLFGGSGSTLIACEKSGRRAHLMELDPKYVDAIIDRWEALTKQKAVKI